MKIRKLRKFAGEITRVDVKNGILKVADSADRIFQNFQKDPKDIKAARQFITYYLDAVINVVGQYSSLPESAPGKKDYEKKLLDLLTTASASFEKQLERLYEDDYLNLDTEMTVLEKALKSDGTS